MLLLDKTLLRLSKGLWGWILAIAAVHLLSLIFLTKFSQILGSYLGSVFAPVYDPQALMLAIRQAFLIALLALASKLIEGELKYRCAAAARTSMRSAIFRKILELDAGSIEKIGPVSSVTSSVDAVENMQVYVSEYLPSLIYSALAPVYLFFTVKKYSIAAALLLIAVSLVLLPLHNLFRFRIENLRKKYWHSVDDMTGYYLDSIRGIAVLKLFDRDKDHSAVLSEKAETLNQNINAFMKINFTSFLVTEGLMGIATALVVWIVLKQDLSLADALTLLMLAYGYFSAERELMSATHNALTAVSAAVKVKEIMDTDTSRPYNPDASSDPYESEGIRMEDVTFSYPGRTPVLKQASLYIPKGKMTALIGLSGSGKSTIGSLLMKFMDPQKGRIWIDGIDTASLKPEEVRHLITMVPQTVSIFTGTIRDNLKFASPSASEQEMKEVLREVRLNDFAENPDRQCGDSGRMLSGGQKQKIGIARALLSKAPYIILDEATSSVDPQSEKEIWETIEKLAESRTLIVISHRLASIRSAECIYVIENGVISEHGNHASLMQENGFYARLAKEQAALEKEAAE